MSTFLIVGIKFSGLTNYLQAAGHDYIELRDKTTTKYPDKRLKKRQLADFSSISALLADVDKVAQKHKIDGVLAIYENYILPAAQIANHLSLPGLPVEAAKACTDKELMRQLFSQAPAKISPDFAVVESVAEVIKFAKNHSFPLILKPANLVKSLLVTKNDNLEQLLANYHRTVDQIDKTYKKYAANRQPKLLIEEFMDGSVHSVETFVDKNGQPHVLDQVVDYQTGYDVGFNDNFHYSRRLPSQLSPDQQAAIRQTAVIGCQALGMKNSPAHVEIILTKNGPMIVEIGARNGGYRERMHGLANDIDIVGNAVGLALGQTPNIMASRNQDCAVLELFPKQPGIFQGINHEDELKRLPSLSYFNKKASQGDWVGKSSDGHKMCAAIILHHEDSKQFERDLDFVNNQVRVLTKS